jgi:hypothetical protein
VNLNIQLPVPPGRGITVPIAETYNSNGVNHITEIQPTDPGWDQSFNTTTGGWLLDYPQLSVGGGVMTTVSPDGNSNCPYVNSFVFSNASGVLIQFSAFAMDYMSNTNLPCGGGINQSSSVDGYSIFLTPIGPPGCTPAYTCVSNFLSVAVTDPYGTVYSFSNVLVNGPDIYYPTSVEDRNGNIVTFSGSGFGSATTVTDSVGRTYTVGEVPGQSYQYTWTSVPVSYTVNSTQVDPAPAPIICIWPSTVSSTKQIELQSITLPNNQQYTFS